MLRYLLILPRALRWVDGVIAQHDRHASPISNLGLERLPLILPPEVLSSVKLAVVARVPQPPLEKWGISGGLAEDSAAGIALDQLICVRRGLERSESLIFHELVHALQWRALGRRGFLMLYGLLLADVGYRDHPLELMAYELQRQFDAGDLHSDVTPNVERRTRELCQSYRRRSLLHRAIFAGVPPRRARW